MIKRLCGARIPSHLRDEMRLEVGVRGDWTRMKMAQLRYDPATGRWTLYGPAATSSDSATPTLNPTGDLDEVLAEIKDYPTSIFFGQLPSTTPELFSPTRRGVIIAAAAHRRPALE